MIQMNNITTTIRDTVSITETRISNIEEFDVNFNQNSKTVNHKDYSLGNVEKHPTFVNFIKNTLSNFELLNENETIDFIIKNMGLIELIEKVTYLIKTHFPNNTFALEYEIDLEIPSFNKIIVYVKGEEESFDEDWEVVKKVNKEIRNLSLYDDSVKSLLSVDLW